MAEFTLLVTKSTTGETYRGVVEKIRKRVATAMSTHDVPLLNPQQAPRPDPSLVFQVKLQTDDAAIDVMIRGDNIYLLGYKASGTTTQWNEFDFRTAGAPNLIPGSRIMTGLDGSYGSLGANHRDNRPLGRKELIDAITDLGADPRDYGAKQKESLTVLLQMISESVRYVRISNLLSTNFVNSVRTPLWMVDLENDWDAICKRLRQIDANPTVKWFPPDNTYGIPTPAQAKEVLAVSLYFLFTAEEALTA